MNEKNARFPINLFCSLMLLSFIPFLYTIMRTKLLVNSPMTDGLGIAGHLEWFDLINETVQAFLIVPLYALFHKCMQDTEKFKERIFQSFLVVHVAYFIFAIIVFIHCEEIVSAMAMERVQEVTRYLALETIGFLIANTVSFANVLFVVLGKPGYVYTLVILKTVFTMLGDSYLIPTYGVDGVAYSNIVVNSVCVVLCLVATYKEKLMAVSFRFERAFGMDYLFIGLFSGAQILLDNLIYSAIVCKMVNAVSEQGNYWTANNIIWGLLLIPVLALAEIIKRDCKHEITTANLKSYHMILLVTFLAWLCFIPMLSPFLKYVMGIEQYLAIKHILVLLLPFYCVYGYTVLIDNLLIGNGKTQYCFAVSVVVNLIYYPVVYGLMRKGIFTPSLTFICMMFGFGMVAHFGCSIVCFLIYKRRKCQS